MKKSFQFPNTCLMQCLWRFSTLYSLERSYLRASIKVNAYLRHNSILILARLDMPPQGPGKTGWPAAAFNTDIFAFIRYHFASGCLQ